MPTPLTPIPVTDLDIRIKAAELAYGDLKLAKKIHKFLTVSSVAVSHPLPEGYTAHETAKEAVEAMKNPPMDTPSNAPSTLTQATQPAMSFEVNNDAYVTGYEKGYRMATEENEAKQARAEGRKSIDPDTIKLVQGLSDDGIKPDAEPIPVQPSLNFRAGWNEALDFVVLKLIDNARVLRTMSDDEAIDAIRHEAERAKR